MLSHHPVHGGGRAARLRADRRRPRQGHRERRHRGAEGQGRRGAPCASARPTRSSCVRSPPSWTSWASPGSPTPRWTRSAVPSWYRSSATSS
ncbi:hypothetical protein LV779_19500 [Streptomyces thinghirensis]|nr:hypothetical protein [Streptomyces thinghirensis]